jgi:tetratricopeptide (TPR) repeat protein
MSYINSALKKVQKEKDGRYAPYGGVIVATGDKKSPARKRRTAFFSLGAVSIAAILSGLGWLFYPGANREIKPARSAPPLTTVASLPAPTVAVPVKDLAGLEKADRLYEEALVAQRGKRWEEAESFYRQVLALAPRHLHALNNLGVLYMRKNRPDEAIELFIKAVAAKEDYVDPYYNLACLYSQLGNGDAALHYLGKAIKVDGSVREWAKKDTDFKKMHSLPAFKKITEELIK